MEIKAKDGRKYSLEYKVQIEGDNFLFKKTIKNLEDLEIFKKTMNLHIKFPKKSKEP